MRAHFWTALATVLIGLSLLTLAQSSPAGTIPGCCICVGCPSGGAAATCEDLDPLGGPANCGNFCATNNCLNGSAQTTLNGTCADVAACQASGPAQAPALDAFGLTGAALLLTAIGLAQVVRRRQH